MNSATQHNYKGAAGLEFAENIKIFLPANKKIKQPLTFTLYIHASYHQGFWCKQFLRKIL
jgi:hypothetical protein